MKEVHWNKRLGKLVANRASDVFDGVSVGEEGAGVLFQLRNGETISSVSCSKSFKSANALATVRRKRTHSRRQQ